MMQEEIKKPQNAISGSSSSGRDISLAVASALRFEHRFFIRELGGLLPDYVPLDEVHDVLDFLCGPGSWCIDLSKHYPHMRVVGVDRNPEMIRIASEDAAIGTSTSPSFQAIDTVEHLPFPDSSFDVIHLKSGTITFQASQWPSILGELSRLLRPGGWLCLLDAELGLTSSLALDQLFTLIGQALVKAERSTSSDGMMPFTAAVYLPRFLRQAGYTEVNYQLYPLNLGGWNNPTGRAFANLVVAGHPLLGRALVNAGLGTEAEVHALLKEVRQQVQQIDFCGAGVLFSVIGRKVTTSTRVPVRAFEEKEKHLESVQPKPDGPGRSRFDLAEAKIASLSIEHRFFTAALDGLLPSTIPMHAVKHVFDVGSGAGGWALDLIRQYPSVQVIGIDTSEKAIREAERMSHYYSMRSAKFILADATQQLPFKDDTFDLVHMRFMGIYIHPATWPAVLAEMLRVLRPGGWITIVDIEQGASSNKAFSHMMALVMRAFHVTGLSLAPFSNTLGVAARAYSMLLNAYLLDVSYEVHIADFGDRNYLNTLGFKSSTDIMLLNYKPLVMRAGLVDSTTWSTLMAQAHEEAVQPDSCGYGYLISSFGRKES